MSEAWEDVTLNEISEDVTVGHVGPMADQYLDVGVPFIRSLNVEPFRINTTDLKYISRDFHQRLKKSALKPGDVVIVRTGKPGSCAVIPHWLSEANCSDVVVVRPGPKVRPAYVAGVVNSSAAHHIDAHTVGAVQQHFNVASARQIRFRLPPIAEQDRILSVLGALDDKIELNRRMNETLEVTARTIFKDWFVDFGPTRAKMERRLPYLASEIWALFPDRLDAEGKPERWEFARVRDVIKFNPSERLESGQSAPYLDMASLPTSGSWPDAPVGRPFASGSKFRKWRRTPCADYSLLGKRESGVHLPDHIVGWGSTEFIVMRALQPMPAEYAYLIARDAAFKERAVQSMTGTSGRQRVQVDSLTEFVVTKPSADIAHKFGTIVTPYFSMIATNARQSHTLAATRDLLLPKLMSGEICVKDAEEIAEAVA